MPIQLAEYDGVAAVVYETDAVQATIVPQIGGKVVSLIDRGTGRELLWRQPGRRLRQPVYGDTFADYDISGWDECFPSISPCAHPDAPWESMIVPDHGELWALPWNVELDGNDLIMRADGMRFPYTFTRRFQPVAQGLQVHYTVTNTSASPFRCLWSIHPFLAATPTTRILLPEGVHVYVEQSKDERLGVPGTEHGWPMTLNKAGQPIDLSLMGPRDQGDIEKLFVHGLPAGWVAALDEETGDYTAFLFDHRQLPYVGMAINRGAWPDEDPAFSLILEPCSGWPDDLSVAIAQGDYVTLEANGTLEWTVHWRMGRGREQLLNVLANGVG